MHRPFLLGKNSRRRGNGPCLTAREYGFPAQNVEVLVFLGARMSNGQSIVIKGDISGSEDLVIAGRVEGSITLNGRVLTLAAGSHVVGEVEAGTVVVSGKVEGSVEAKERLDIKSTAVVDGTLSTARLIVADGSQITAKVEMPAQKPKLAVAG
jgi:cytoskeletal protein CcmA (bactofilin family)